MKNTEKKKSRGRFLRLVVDGKTLDVLRYMDRCKHANLVRLLGIKYQEATQEEYLEFTKKSEKEPAKPTCQMCLPAGKN